VGEVGIFGGVGEGGGEGEGRCGVRCRRHGVGCGARVLEYECLVVGFLESSWL